MTPQVAFTVGATLFGGMMVVAQELSGAPLDGDVLLFTIFSLGSGIIAWLVRRESNDRKADQEVIALQNKQRRDVDLQREERIRYLEDKYTQAMHEKDELYERFLRVAHQLHPDLPFPESTRRDI